MTKTKNKHAKLEGGLKNTASSVEIKENGDLVVELYDFSESAQDHFGNDVAFLLTVSSSDKQSIQSALANNQDVKDNDQDTVLLELIKNKFLSYYEVKEWLDKLGIAYKKEFDSWA